MNLHYSSEKLSDLSVGTIVYFISQYDKVTDRRLKQLDTATGGAVSTLLASEEFCGKPLETAILYKPAEFKADRVLLVGLGQRSGMNADSIRRAAGVVSRNKAFTGARQAAFVLGVTEKVEFFQAAIEGMMLGSFKLLEFKSGEDAKNKSSVTDLYFVTQNGRTLKKVQKAVERGEMFAEAQNLVRTLASIPSNMLTPKMYAERIQKLARTYKVSCKVLDEKTIVAEKMGAMLSVAKGSNEPPRFIILEYKGGSAGQKPIVLVGKGVTFDSGGISLKPSLNMHEMKADMTGSAVVLATILTVSRMKVPQHIVALMPLTENMPSGKATRPGDIITSRKGLTIEVINTDAEGRLILADALDYANKFKPQAVIDIATLTGATLYILGYSGAPFVGNNRSLVRRIEAAANTTSERVWEMPLWDDYRDLMKSTIADLKNSGGRPAGTLTAAAFLENFIGDYPWAHIDIAYVDVEPAGKPYIPAGNTGIGARLLIEVLSNWKKL
ncbi:MAG TPA: leucyl aminopeptidase [candidate division Zixibacteria bacterium]|nr:leucyl aminopeptidase [candidate division Zixibacteria bacterium]